ncbi:MAG: hypothetical protein H7X97_12355 [Opitutaceae bacterium]|nr:hypothetical protein [Verrucomicrobiales bacterium]
MNRFLCAILLVGLIAGPARSGQEGASVTYYIQLIHGTNDPDAQKPNWKAVGPKLSQVFSPAFTWKHYWEVKRQEVVVTGGKVSKVKVTDDRSLEIELMKDGQTELRLYRVGELKRKMRTSGESKMSILGGDAAGKDGWFIVVRRDKPSTD